MNTLQHHGILGQKWGVRRFQNKDGSLTPAGEERYGHPDEGTYDVVKKGSEIYRVSNNKNDTVYDNKKYASLTKDDHKKWQKYLGDDINKYGGEAYDVTYKATKDLKIAHYTEVGKIYTEKILNNKAMKQKIFTDTYNASRSLGYKSNDLDDMLGTNFAMQTETGKMFVQELMKRGYNGVQDRHGQNTASNPVIFFDPENNLKKKKISRYKS